MKRLDPALSAHLRGEATTTCHCWRVTRRDGAVIGVTEHDHDLLADGTLFHAASGFTASEGEAETGLAAASGEVTGGFSSTAIAEADLAAGLYDGARIEVFLVNWAEPEMHVLLHLREIGEVARTGARFSAELRSIAHRLGQPQGRVYGPRCDAALGDRRCGVDLINWRGQGTVIAMPDENRIIAAGLAGFEPGFFSRGHLALKGAPELAVENHAGLADGTSELTLWLPLATAVAPGTAFTVTAGCDKSFTTCKARFANHLNFRGFPHMPGADFAYSYAAGDGNHDGGALFS